MDRPVTEAPAPHSLAECRERIAAYDDRAGHMTLATVLAPGVTLALYTFADSLDVVPRSVPAYVLPVACVALGAIGAAWCLRVARIARRRARTLEARIARRERESAS